MKLLQRLAPDGAARSSPAMATISASFAASRPRGNWRSKQSLQGIRWPTRWPSADLRDTLDIAADLADGRLLAPIDHPDPAHLWLAGTGLTHLGSAEGRDRMHKAAAEGEQLTDSMRMFLEGLEGGKPAEGAIGQQPEWFYKGERRSSRRPGTAARPSALCARRGRGARNRRHLSDRR
jgi:hypothetical protein